MKRIELPLHGIALQLEESAGDEDGSRPTSYSAGTISSELKDTTPCNNPDEEKERCAFNKMIDVIESVILAHAIAGIDVASPAYVEGIETAIDASAQNGNQETGV